MPKQTTVSLGGREYVLTEKVMGVSRVWRKHFRESLTMRVFESLEDGLAQMKAAYSSIMEAVEPSEEEGTSRDDRAIFKAGVTIATIAPAIVRGLASSIDEIIDLLFDYAPELVADEEWLAENAYNEEFVDAFIEVLKLNYPIWALWGLVSGRRALPTNTNLPSLNGVGSGTKKGSARSKSR